MLALNLLGVRFGRLVVTAPAANRGVKTAWACRCDCGTESVVKTNNLRLGHTASCGCLHREARLRSKNKTHGHAGSDASREYRSWRAMLNRCRNPKAHAFERYGGRGITVCDRWSRFENFLADMGERPPATTLDRVRNDGNYEPANCRWATWTEQAKNRRKPKPKEGL